MFEVWLCASVCMLMRWKKKDNIKAVESERSSNAEQILAVIFQWRWQVSGLM